VQLKFASLDLELHTKYVPGGPESIYDVDRRVSEKTQVIPPLPEDRFLCSFSHIFAGLLHLLFFLVVGNYANVSTKKKKIDFWGFHLLGGYAAGYYSYKVYSALL